MQVPGCARYNDPTDSMPTAQLFTSSGALQQLPPEILHLPAKAKPIPFRCKTRYLKSVKFTPKAARAPSGDWRAGPSPTC